MLPKLKVLIRKCLPPPRYMPTPPTHTEFRSLRCKIAVDLSICRDERSCSIQTMLGFVWGDPNREFGFHCNRKQTGNQSSLPSSAAMSAPKTSLLGYSSRVLCSLLRFLSRNLHSTSLTQSQSRVLGKINYTPGLPLTGNTSSVANMSFNLKKIFR